MNTSGIWSTKDCLSGKPCIREHKFSMAQLITEVSDGKSLRGIAEDYEIDYDKIELAWTDLVQELRKLKINSQYIMSDPETRGGENCIHGHRIPINLILMNLLQENSIPKQEAYDYDLEDEEVEGVLWNLASLLDRDWTNGPPEDKTIAGGPT
jgi:uncharacterized protein (DUF433 family)